MSIAQRRLVAQAVGAFPWSCLKLVKEAAQFHRFGRAATLNRSIRRRSQMRSIFTFRPYQERRVLAHHRLSLGPYEKNCRDLSHGRVPHHHFFDRGHAAIASKLTVPPL
jgi:hypothetical protein